MRRVQEAALHNGLLLRHLYRAFFAASPHERFHSCFVVAFLIKDLPSSASPKAAEATTSRGRRRRPLAGVSAAGAALLRRVGS